MASSDDEGETLAQSVSNYYLVDGKNEPVSFSVLPIQWSEAENSESTEISVFLCGTADDGLQKIFKQVKAWKIEFSDEGPSISLLSKEMDWIKLVKARKSYEDIIRTSMITVWCLYLVKKNPETRGKSLWDQLQNCFSAYEIKPSESDLLDHIPLIRAAILLDEALARSTFLVTFLANPIKRKGFAYDDQNKSGFIVDDNEESDDDMGTADEDGLDKEIVLFDSVCCVCDDGGEILCCDGRCMRSFHIGADSDCNPLGLSATQIEAMPIFLCLNCQHKRHQCFACGQLGSSDKSDGAEIYSCVSATCGFFYHSDCVAKLLYPTDEVEAEDCQKKIAAGESFTCPIHKCHICEEREDTDISGLPFAVCRRCPTAYHRKCLPAEITFEDPDDQGIIVRAWDGLLPNSRVLIYCLKHEIDKDLKTPIRSHIMFPLDEKTSVLAIDLQSSNTNLAKRRLEVNEYSLTEERVSKKSKHCTSAARSNSFVQKRENRSSGKEWDFSAKSKMADAPRKVLKDGIKSLSKVVLPPPVDAETKRRITALMEKSTSLITLKEVVKGHKVPSTHANSSKFVVDKTITYGKVEGFVEAVRTALKKLEEGGSIEDAKAICGPDIVNQLVKWKKKLKVYLAPFLHGKRYTSFGRHFTKVDKLKGIVDKLHSYVLDGDTIVDFCCGSNDFSWLMKGKLEETGKVCSFKNFDIFQPKNDFSFEQRDWMTVSPTELPSGSKLIMGLNPPFGVNASLANKFIDKALQFKPKLIILIVPPETERLDQKKSPYDLVWEDNESVSGKSFYLPGSTDLNDETMEQWNIKPPLLNLWSRPDWTANHKAIALKQGHTKGIFYRLGGRIERPY